MGSARRATLPRSARLKRRRLIRPLFDRTRTDVGSLAVGTIRLVYRVVARSEEEAAGTPVQVGFAPGRGLRNAVARNRVKRVMREVYRVHQHQLIDLFLQQDRMLTLMVLFRGRYRDHQARIAHDLPRALGMLAERISTCS